MQFKEIEGHEAVKQGLIRSVKEGRISHAQLFLAPEGSGGLSMAIAYAQYISCENPGDTDSCGTCPSCGKYERFVHPDLHFSFPFIASETKKQRICTDVLPEWRKALCGSNYLSLESWMAQLDAENKQPNIPMAECHDMIRKMSLKSFESGYKVLIIWLPEFLGKEGNALLKMIEEPAPKTLFLLVAENSERILATIRSRTQLLKMNKLSHENIRNYFIQKECCTPEQAGRIAYLAEGNMATAFEVFQEAPNGESEVFINWMRRCFEGMKKGKELVDFVDVFAKNGRERQKNCLRFGLSMIRDCLLFAEGSQTLIYLEGEELSFVQKFSTLLNRKRGELIIKEFEQALYQVERNANPKILFLDVSLRVNQYFRA